MNTQVKGGRKEKWKDGPKEKEGNKGPKRNGRNEKGREK